MKLKTMKVAELVKALDPKNARKHDEKNLKAIAASLKQFDQYKNIVWWQGKVLCGNGTVEAAKSIGRDELEVHDVSHLSEQDAMALALADNRTAELAVWDDDVLGEQLQTLYEDGYAIADIGFDWEDQSSSGGGQTDDDEVPEIEENVFGVKRGDIWQLGEHRLMCGDSTSKNDVDRLMNGEKADMVFTDPPYGMRLDTDYSKMPRGENSYRKVEGDHEDFDASIIFNIKSDRYCVWGADWFYDSMPGGFSPIVWDKQPHHIEAGPQNHFELCWVFPKEKRRIIRHLWTGFTAKEKNESRVHPTQKPIEVCEEIMKRGGKNVVDLFGGSGSTLIACEKTGRKCFMSEIDPHYCSVIIKRWQDYTSKEAKLLTA